jgi:hypothetical protein
MQTTPDPNGVVISRAELLWLTLGTWIGGIFTLTVLPLLLIPGLGIPAGMSVSYLVFFAAWQPVQIVTQRVLGMGTAVVRMLAFVSVGAAIAYYLRELLMGLARS